MRVAFFSSEVAPFVKTGGLADVAGSLPIALEDEGIEVVVVMPGYQAIETVTQPAAIGQRVRVYFIEHPSFFSREGLYGNRFGDFPDNLERFSFFCRQSLKLLKEINFKPSLLHCNDWQTALIPIYLKALYQGDQFFDKTKTILTIHNMAYQGIFPKDDFPKIGIGEEWLTLDCLEFFNQVNLLKGGIRVSDVVTTVSPTYAKEIQTSQQGCRLDGVLRSHRDAIRGILNGIDTDQWNPEKDSEIAGNYNADTFKKKVINKLDLQKRVGFIQDPKIPLFGMVSRLADQKGLDLVTQAIEDFCRHPSEMIQWVLLGTGDDVYHHFFSEIQQRYSTKVSVHLKFDPVLAKRIYAGADLFLMPSRYEPCGLGQMIALRYGTIPIARKTGGLSDTVKDVDQSSRGNGFVFEEYSAGAFEETIQRALKIFKDSNRWEELIQRAMSCDFSWSSSAKEYVKLYQRIEKVME